MIRSIPVIFAERAVKHLIRRFFGQYLEFKHQELTWSLKKGKGVLEDVSLKVEALNELSEEYNLPIEFLHGTIQVVSVEIPWTKPFTENSVLEFKGMKLVVQPKRCSEDTSVFGSMWESMTTSLQLAEECLQEKLDNEPEFVSAEPMEAVDLMVSAINMVLSKMKFKFIDSVIRIENILENGTAGVALEIHIKSADCFDEIGIESTLPSDDNLSSFDQKINPPAAYSIKKCMLEGISLYTAHFSTSSSSVALVPPKCSESVLEPGSPELPPPHSSLLKEKKDEILPVEPILISRISGQQQIRLKLKQNESTVGPMVDIEANFGLVNFLLTPFQVQVLLELANGLTRPGSLEKQNLKKCCSPTATNRPMKPEDFALVEQELQRRQQGKLTSPSKSLQNQCGWSSHPIDDSEEEFFLMPMETFGKRSEDTTPPPPVLEDCGSSCNSLESEYMPYCASDVADGSSARTNKKARDCASDVVDGSSARTNKKAKGASLQVLLTDSLSELTQLRACCSSVCIIVLHEECVTDDANKDGVVVNYRTPEGVDYLRQRALQYFEALSSFMLEGVSFKEFGSVRKKISNHFSGTNHLSFLASSVTFEGNEKTSTSQRLFSTTVTMLNLEIMECVFNTPASEGLSCEPSYTELVSFDQSKLKTKFGNIKEPCFKMKCDRIDRGAQQRVINLPTNKVTFHLAPVSFEVDISLTDRIRSFFNPDSMFTKKENKFESLHFSWIEEEEAGSHHFSQKTEFQFICPFVLVNLRFPVPDKRPIHDMDRAPWWQQKLRKEILVMELTDATLGFIVDREEHKQKFEFQCRDFHGLFQMSQNEEPISFCRVTVDPDSEKIDSDKGFDWPRLVLYVTPQRRNDLGNGEPVLDKDEDLGPVSISDIILAQVDKGPSPFRSNAILYGSEPRFRNNSKPGTNENINIQDNEIIRPTEKEKMLSFFDQIVNSCCFVLDFSLPNVNIVFPNKNFFELLYNRLCNDLALWEKAPVGNSYNHDNSGFRVHAPLHLITETLKNTSFQSFHSCTSNNMNDSYSESDEEDGVYHSLSEHSLKQSQKFNSRNVRNQNFTKVAVSLAIAKGSVIIQNALKDSSGNIVPGYCGKTQLVVDDCKFFIASSYKGDPSESYICLLSNKATLYYIGASLLPIEMQVVQPFDASSCINTNPILYLSGPGVSSNTCQSAGCGGNSLDMLTISVQVSTDKKQQIKTCKIAMGLCGTTLRHFMSPSSQFWLSRFIDFVTVRDFTISGYTPPSVVVEFHLHLENCAIDYRPLFLPLRSVLTVENFSLSTNITSSTSTSLLRIISEELCLFISNDLTARNVDLEKGYVCVVDTGLVDLSVQLTKSNGETQPKFEICASNNIIHIRTCADSCRALQLLLIYIANYGDFRSEKDFAREANLNSKTIDEADKNGSKTSNSSENVVHNMMVEAMKEYPSPRHSNSRPHSSDSDMSTDEEYCIVDHIPDFDEFSKHTEPQIRVLTTDEIKIVENHFTIPSGKSDLLKAPKHFPKHVLCHTLREMSIIWHLYGGNDFKKKSTEKKRVRISCENTKDSNQNEGVNCEDQQSVKIDASKNRISFCKVTPLTRDFNVNAVQYTMETFSFEQTKSSSSRSWITKGGEDRNHEILMELQMSKVRFQHEEYPADSEYASRDVLLIHDIEIRDRLAASQINKFLYQYSSESMPRQTHANMIVIKAVHVRPDPKEKIEECCLKVSCKPLRLNIDQDALMFLYDFFKEFCEGASDESPQKERPVLPEMQDHAQKSDTLLNSNEPAKNPLFSPISPTPSSQGKDLASLTFFRSFSFSPDVLIRLDYHGKRVVMEQGALQGLLMGLGQLNCSEIKLKKLSYRHGFLGWEKLVSYATNEWLQDVKKNQLPSLLGGIGPMHSFVQLFQGLKDLVWLPVEQYRKDGQIVRGLQRGASSFSTSTAAAFLELTSLLVSSIQEAAEIAYDMVSPGPVVGSRLQRNLNQNRRTSQPADIREGMTTAYNVVKEGLGDTARTIVRVASVEHEHKGVRGAVGGVLRQIPPAAVKPIILSTEAACIVLGGVKHQLVPDAHKEAMDKWRTKNN